MGYIEANIEIPVCDHAENLGWLCRKVSWVGRTKAPDRFFAKAGHTSFFVEFKKPGEGLDPGQKREVGRLRKAGVEVYEIDSVEDGCALFD